MLGCKMFDKVCLDVLKTTDEPNFFHHFKVFEYISIIMQKTYTSFVNIIYFKFTGPTYF